VSSPSSSTRAEGRLKQKVCLKRLGVVLHSVWCLAKQYPTLEVSTLIGCAKLLTSLIVFDVSNATPRFQWCKSLPARFFTVVLGVGRAIFRSPIYPHLRTMRLIGFLLCAAFDDLAAASIQKSRELLTYLLNGETGPSSGLEFLDAEGYITANLGPLVRLGLELLKVSALIG
jgi:hypothetical protein